MAINPLDPNQLKRIDENLQVIRDKVEEAERISGKTRSEFLERVSSMPTKKKSVEMDLEVEIKDKQPKLIAKKKKIKIDPNDPLNVKKMLLRHTFSLLPDRIKGDGLLTT